MTRQQNGQEPLITRKLRLENENHHLSQNRQSASLCLSTELRLHTLHIHVAAQHVQKTVINLVLQPV